MTTPASFTTSATTRGMLRSNVTSPTVCWTVGPRPVSTKSFGGAKRQTASSRTGSIRCIPRHPSSGPPRRESTPSRTKAIRDAGLLPRPPHLAYSEPALSEQRPATWSHGTMRKLSSRSRLILAVVIFSLLLPCSCAHSKKERERRAEEKRRRYPSCSSPYSNAQFGIYSSNSKSSKRVESGRN